MSSTAPAVIRIDALLDVDYMAPVIYAAASDAADAGILRSARLIDHKPGRRALVAYRGDALEIYGKAYADPVAAARSYDVLRQCHDLFADTPGLGVPQPLGLVGDLAVLLYVPLSGPSLDELASTAEITACLRASAEWLAVFHGARLHLERVLDVPHEAANAAEWAAVIGGAHPALADRTSALADALLAEPVPAVRRAVPIHKDFHYQHVIAGDEIGVVDLDEARMGDAAFDVAHFAVNLHLLALRTAPCDHDADRWLQPFLVAYATATGWTLDDAFRWYAAYTCLKVARQLATGSGPRPRPTGAARQQQVNEILAEGLACLHA